MKEHTSKASVPAIQAVQTSLAVAFAIANADGPSSVTALAVQLDMLPSTVYRHLRALVSAGLLTQVEQNGRYDLGPNARMLGLAALRRLDPQHFWGDSVERLRDEVNQTVLAVVWERHGPVAVLSREPRGQVITIKPGIGAPMRVLGSASGLVFCTHLPPEQTHELVATEFALSPGPVHNGKKLTRRRFDLLLERIRIEGHCAVTGATVQGVGAIAAPVFGADGQLELVIAILGPDRSMDLRPSGKLVGLLCDECQRLSSILGFRGGVAQRF